MGIVVLGMYPVLIFKQKKFDVRFPFSVSWWSCGWWIFCVVRWWWIWYLRWWTETVALCWWWRWWVSDHGGERMMIEDSVKKYSVEKVWLKGVSHLIQWLIFKFSWWKISLISYAKPHLKNGLDTFMCRAYMVCFPCSY